MHILIKRLGISLLYLTAFPLLAEPSPWQHVSTQGGIIVHKRERASGLIEVRAQTLAKTTLSAFLNLVQDTENVPRWVSHATQATVLTSFSDNEFLVHTLFTAPWPASNRDMVTHSVSTYPDAHTLILEVKDASEQKDNSNGYVRMTDVEANWTLQELSNGLTHISYTAYANPEGLLPVWITNEITLDSVKSTFQALKKRLPLYQQKALQ